MELRRLRRARRVILRERTAPPPADPSPPGPAPGPPAPPEPAEVLLCWPLDHFYSPVPDSRALAREPERTRIWPDRPPETPGLDWQPAEQAALLADLGSQPQLEISTEPTGDPTEYHSANDMFSRLDAWLLQGILRKYRPERVVEVGCGWSSLMTARIGREELGGGLDFTCIEPYPPEFLAAGVPGVTRLIERRVQDAGLEPFLALRANDVLFIDSSHTVKTGSDVEFLLAEVLPRLAPGVVVHFHDIFLPRDYPQDWVFSGRAWNEQYAVRAFLAFNQAFRILIGSGWLLSNAPELLRRHVPGYPAGYEHTGGSLWIQREN